MQSLQEHWLDALSEFLAAFLHLTLYVTEVYPATAFEPKQIYSTRVYQCRHPQVISYVATAVKQLKSLLKLGAVAEVAFVRTDQQGKARHRVALLVEDLTLNPSSHDVDWQTLKTRLSQALIKLLHAGGEELNPPALKARDLASSSALQDRGRAGPVAPASAVSELLTSSHMASGSGGSGKQGKAGSSRDKDAKKKKIDEETERLLTQLLLRRGEALLQQSKDEGVLAFCRQPAVRGQINERFLQNTLRNVFTSNKRTDESKLWEMRQMQRDREERSRSPHVASTSGRSEARPGDGGARADTREHGTAREREGDRQRRRRSRSRSRSRGDRGASPVSGSERDSAPDSDTSPQRPKQQHSGDSGEGDGTARSSDSSGSSSDSDSGDSAGKDGQGAGASGRGASRSAEPTSSARPTSEGSDHDDDKDQADSPGKGEGWVMTEEEFQEMLTKYRRRGRGGSGPRADMTGPFLPEGQESRSTLDGVQRGPSAPAWMVAARGRMGDDGPSSAGPSAQRPSAIDKGWIPDPDQPKGDDLTSNPDLLRLLRKIAKRKVKEEERDKRGERKEKKSKSKKRKRDKKEKRERDKSRSRKKSRKSRTRDSDSSDS